MPIKQINFIDCCLIQHTVASYDFASVKHNHRQLIFKQSKWMEHSLTPTLTHTPYIRTESRAHMHNIANPDVWIQVNERKRQSYQSAWVCACEWNFDIFRHFRQYNLTSSFVDGWKKKKKRANIHTPFYSSNASYSETKSIGFLFWLVFLHYFFKYF